MIIDLVILIGGLVALWLGAEFTINAAINIAKSMKISEGFIGLTILSIGTSLPEIFAHIYASIKIVRGGDGLLSNLVVGTNIGSNIVQITFVLGMVGLLAKVYSDEKILKIDFIVMLASILILFFISLSGHITRLEGVILALLYIGYLIYLSKEERIFSKRKDKSNIWLDVVLIIVGFALLLGGAKFALEAAVRVTEILGWRGSFVGTMIIGVGTALPELTTSLVGIIKGKHALSLGTLVGSNITNPLFALGIGAAISGYLVERSLVFFDIPFWFIVSLIGLGFFWDDLKLSKRESAILVLFYAVYVFVKVKFFVF
ncbi:MAG: sodium:calcium antiporter [Nanoarchaeota archaeon]|nr:sodium:calcium antiporter [Nanoarchaeota archaeon]MBU1704651.1 sodium:calcium antiporter [Nanoarchaeota archaeon]